MWRLSRAEEITSEVRRLVLTCKAMEAQLQQSIPKKTHEEVVRSMQATIDDLGAQVADLKTEIQHSSSLRETISGLGNQLVSQNDTISSLTRTVGDLNQVIDSQKASIAELSTKLSQSTVPSSLYDQTVSRLRELQERVQNMVERTDYASLQRKCDELSESMKSMVPREEYSNLQTMLANSVPKTNFEALQATLSQYVPREQLAASEARVNELEFKMQNYVPRADYDELTAKIRLLTREFSSITNMALAETTETTEQTARPEIAEIQSNLSDIKGAEDTGAQTLNTVDATRGFVFSNTEFCATTPSEFLQDLEQAPIESIENHSRSGDFERWFKDVIADSTTAEALRSVRESNCAGDDLRTKLVAVIAPRYKLVTN